MKGAAKQMPAFRKWSTDERIVEEYSTEELECELEKKETRQAKQKAVKVATFAQMYNKSEIYAVTDLLQTSMAQDVLIPRFMRCGTATSYLDSVLLWWGSGGQRSVIHNDAQDNLNCVLAGQKRFILWHPRHKGAIESEALGWVNAEERESRSQDNGEPSAYGSYSLADVEAMDLAKQPGWGDLDWYDAELEAGDCLFLPTAWYHHVASYGRSIAVNVWWWRRERYPAKWDTCAAADVGHDVQDAAVAAHAAEHEATLEPDFGSCTATYRGPPDRIQGKDPHHFRTKKATRCGGVAAVGQSKAEPRHATALITKWNRMEPETLPVVSSRQWPLELAALLGHESESLVPASDGREAKAEGKPEATAGARRSVAQEEMGTAPEAEADASTTRIPYAGAIGAAEAPTEEAPPSPEQIAARRLIDEVREGSKSEQSVERPSITHTHTHAVTPVPVVPVPGPRPDRNSSWHELSSRLSGAFAASLVSLSPSLSSSPWHASALLATLLTLTVSLLAWRSCAKTPGAAAAAHAPGSGGEKADGKTATASATATRQKRGAPRWPDEPETPSPALRGSSWRWGGSSLLAIGFLTGLLLGFALASAAPAIGMSGSFAGRPPPSQEGAGGEGSAFGESEDPAVLSDKISAWEGALRNDIPHAIHLWGILGFLLQEEHLRVLRGVVPGAEAAGGGGADHVRIPACAKPKLQSWDSKPAKGSVYATWRTSEGEWRLHTNDPCEVLPEPLAAGGTGPAAQEPPWVRRNNASSPFPVGHSQTYMHMETLDTLGALLRCNASEVHGEFAIRTVLILYYAFAGDQAMPTDEDEELEAEWNDGALVEEAAVNFIVEMGQLFPPLRRRFAVLVQPFLALEASEMAAAARATDTVGGKLASDGGGVHKLAGLLPQVQRAWDRTDESPIAPEIATLGAFALGANALPVSPRIRGIQGQRSEHGLFTVDLFTSRLSFYRHANETALSDLMRVARTLAFEQRKEAGRYENNAFFQFFMDHQDRIAEEHNGFRDLKDLARELCIRHLEAQTPRRARGFLRSQLADTDRYKLDLWAMLLERGKHSRHVHEAAVCSGVLYVNVPNQSSPIIFGDPRGTPLHYRETGVPKPGSPDELVNADLMRAPYVSTRYFFPRTGDIILFPSSLGHDVPPGAGVARSAALGAAQAHGQAPPTLTARERERITYAWNLNAPHPIGAWSTTVNAVNPWE